MKYLKHFKLWESSNDIDIFFDHHLINDISIKFYDELKYSSNIQDVFKKVKKRLEPFLNTTRFPIWRAIEVPDTWITELDKPGKINIGTSWSFVADSAGIYEPQMNIDYSKYKRIRIKTFISSKDVDWKSTVRANVIDIIQNVDNDFENEITVFQGRVIKIAAIETDWFFQGVPTTKILISNICKTVYT